MQESQLAFGQVEIAFDKLAKNGNPSGKKSESNLDSDNDEHNGITCDKGDLL